MTNNLLSWTRKQRKLLDIEREEEKFQLINKIQNSSAKECEKDGISILSLYVDSVTTSLYGRTCFSLQRSDGRILPVHSIKTGDEVLLRTKSSTEIVISGVISKVNSTSIEMVSETYDEEELKPPMRLDLSASENTFKKLNYALNDLDRLIDGPSRPIVDIVFNNFQIEEPQPVKIDPINVNLNEFQIDAIESSLGSKCISLIHGPPGTGKTTAVVELILQAARMNKKVDIDILIQLRHINIR